MKQASAKKFDSSFARRLVRAWNRTILKYLGGSIEKPLSPTYSL